MNPELQQFVETFGPMAQAFTKTLFTIAALLVFAVVISALKFMWREMTKTARKRA